MLKMSIQMNTSKILAENKYSLTTIYQAIHSVFHQSGLNKFSEASNSLIYQGNDNSRDFGRFGKIYNFLRKQSWFIDNVSSWILYDNEDSESPDKFYTEDLLQNHHK